MVPHRRRYGSGVSWQRPVHRFLFPFQSVLSPQLPVKRPSESGWQAALALTSRVSENRDCAAAAGSRASRRAEAVETDGIICPLRVAEIGRAPGEGVCAHGRPNRIGQVRAGFHYDDEVAGAGNGKSKPVCLHAEAGIAGLHFRIPNTVARPPNVEPQFVVPGK